MYPVPST